MKSRSTKMMAVLMVSLMAVVALAPLAGEETDAAGEIYTLYGMGRSNYTITTASNTNVTEPTEVEITDPQQIIATTTTLYVLDSNNYLWGRGQNSSGQLGNNSTTTSSTFIRIGESLSIEKVNSVGATLYILTTDHKLYGCGKNENGQLGNNDSGSGKKSTTLIQIGETLGNIVDFDSNEDTVVFVTSDGKLYGCGAASNSQMGPQNGQGNFVIPTQIASNIPNIVEVKKPEAATIFKTSAGELYGLGYNAQKIIPGGNTTVDSATKISGSYVVDSFEVCSNNLAFITQDGTAYIRGSNSSGQLGINSSNTDDLLHEISISNVKKIILGNGSNYLITNDGDQYGSGSSYYGQMGGGSNQNNLVFTQIGSTLGTVVDAMAFDNSYYFINANGELYGCGKNANGQLGVSTPSETNTFLRIGEGLGKVTGVYAAKNSLSGGQSVDATYFITETKTQCTVTIDTNEAAYGSTDETSVVADMESEISASGNVLTIGSTTVTATPTAATSSTLYAFESWTGIPESGLLTDDITITANFSASAIMTVTLDAGKGTVSSSSLTAVEGQPIGDLPTPTPKAGYTFTGWFDSEGNEVTSETIVTETESFTLYAQYELDDSLKPVKAMTDLLPLIFVVGIIILMIGTAFYYYRP